MNSKILTFIGSFMIVACCCFCFSACVAPTAWVKLDMEGYVYHTTQMYASNIQHIYLYNSEAESVADADSRVNYLLAIEFFPRILGTEVVNGEKTTLVDIASGADMQVTINKSASLFSTSKKIYLNDVALEPTSIQDLSTLYALTFKNVSLTRGNPNGKINGFVNKIQYK